MSIIQQAFRLKIDKAMTDIAAGHALDARARNHPMMLGTLLSLLRLTRP
jgi:hypothetical protein